AELVPVRISQHQQVYPAGVGGLVRPVARHAEFTVRLSFLTSQQLRFELNAHQISCRDVQADLIQTHFNRRTILARSSLQESRQYADDRISPGELVMVGGAQTARASVDAISLHDPGCGFSDRV